MKQLRKIHRKDIEDIIALTPMQEGMLFHYLKDPGSDYYFEQLSLEISGELDQVLFEKAWNFVIETNEILRAVFRWEKVEKPSQIILKEHKCKVIFYDLSGKDTSQKKTVLEEIKNKDRRETFDLHRVPFRVTLCKLDEKEFQMIISYHHILYDGWSNGIILKEFFKAYHESDSGNGGKSLKRPVKPPFKEFIKWNQNQDRNKQQHFWCEYLTGLETTTELPIKKRPEEIKGGEVEGYSIILEEDIRSKLEVFAKNNRVTLAAVFYTAWGILLQRYCDSEDVIFGTTVSGRSAGVKGIEEMVGLFINTLPLRFRSAPGAKIMEVLPGIENLLREREEFENTPLVDIASYSSMGGSGSLFDTIIAIENYPLDNRLISEGEGSLLSIDSYSIVEMTHYDLTVGIMPFNETEIKFSYKRQLFDKETIERLAGHFKRIVRNMIENPEAALARLEIISIEEKNRVLYEFNDTTVEYPGNQTIHGLFEEQVERTPDNIALHGCMIVQHVHAAPPVSLTYRELSEESNLLAYALIEKGVKPDTIVGIMLERSVEMIIGILAILKSGGAYLPIDPEYPRERIEYMLKDSGTGVLVSDHLPPAAKNLFEKRFLDFQKLLINEKFFGGVQMLHGAVFRKSPSIRRRHRLEQASLAYVIYTSGSTGRPKGVPVEHASVVNTLWARKHYYEMEPSHAALQLFSYSFDGFITSFFTPIISGARVILLSNDGVKDTYGIARVIGRCCVTHFICVPSLYRVIMEVLTTREAASLQVVTVAGEAVSPDMPGIVSNKNKQLEMVNEYGVTEAAVMSTIHRHQEKSDIISIGKPIWNTRVHILDKSLSLQPIGVSGELCISGIGLARGYLNNPELTKNKFMFNRSYMTYIRLYKTGDLARWLADGNVEFLGRIDHQVKIRGFRIELGEIEDRLLKHKCVKAAAVIATESNIPYLCAYIVLKNEEPGAIEKVPDAAELKKYLSHQLPAYMIPAHFFLVEKIPLTPGGKMDRRALQAANTLLGTGVEYVTPKSDIERTIAGVWQDLLGLDKVGIHDNFFDLGGNSLSIIRLTSRLKVVLPDKKDISVVTLFNHPTVSSQARYLNREEQQAASTVEPGKIKSRFEGSKIEIAVIGMAGRFPGAKDIDEFWNNIKNGVESIRFFTQEHLKRLGVETQLMNDADYVPAKGVLDSKEYFDSFFFGYTPSEVEILDPQVRVFHECTWEALENAGYNPFSYDGTVGLYGGASPNPFWELSPLTSGASGGSYPELWTAIQFSDKDYLSTRIAYKLDLKGPCVTMQTACSTSLAAVDQACRALVSGACTMVLAGGVSVTFQDERGYLYQEGTIMSPDGHCRAFDAGAKGTVGGNGVGVVVLKRLEEAAADGDTVYAVIKGFAINNDGRNKVGFTAPSSEGQSKAIRSALEMAGFNPESIGYIEAHGTGTLLGDPIEIEGLKMAFNGVGSRKKHYCALGSIKTNIGHLDAAAGIAGFIKTVLSLYHRLIPPSLHFETPNPRIDFENSPFYVNTGLKTWESNEYPLRAGISSFGLGGTNVHVVLEEWRMAQSAERMAQGLLCQGRGGVSPPLTSRQYQLLLLSAKTPTALDRMSGNLVRHFEGNPGIQLADAAYTLQVGRKAFVHRKMLVCSDSDDAIRKLQAGEVETGTIKKGKQTIIFMFSGQGSQYVNMGLDLYQNEPVFRRQIDECFELLENIAGIDMKPVLYPGEGTITVEEAGEKIFQFKYTTPIKFIFEYSLAKVFMKWGIPPDAMIGHSFGEYAAACLAGVFSLEDAVFMAALRGRLMHRLPSGAMLSVQLSEEELKPLLTHDISLAAVNGKSMCVVSGPVEAIGDFEGRLNEMGHECLRYRVPKAGHSRMVEPIMAEFKKKIARVKFNKPQIPFISGMSGNWITSAQAMDPGYWTRHLRETVRFADGLSTLLAEPDPVFLQVGPGSGLTMFLNRHPAVKPGILALNMVRHSREKVSDVYYTLKQMGHLWLQGIPVNWGEFYPGEKRWRIPLPGYPFEGKYFPLPPDLFKTGGAVPGVSTAKPLLTERTDIADWFYIPVWEQSPFPPRGAGKPGSTQESCHWLVFMDELGLGSRLIKELGRRKIARVVITVRAGQEYTREKENAYILNPGQPGDYDRLLGELRASGREPHRIIHLWSVLDERKYPGGLETLERIQDLGFHGMLNLARALGREDLSLSREIQIKVVTNHLYSVTGEEDIRPEKATIRGAVKVIPLEYNNINCTQVDIDWSNPRGQVTGRLVRQLLEEFTIGSESGSPDKMVAIRGTHRWREVMRPVRLEKCDPVVQRLKERGVYLITGGLGGMGFTFARYLARDFRAKLILVRRSFFPARKNWDQWLETHPGEDEVGAKIRKIQELEKIGAEIMVCCADVADEEQMQEVAAAAHRRFGLINGVLHTAGVGDYAGEIRQRTREMTDRVMAPKVRGTLVLDKLLSRERLDFLVLFSSLGNIIYQVKFAQVGYNAANEFLEAFAHYKTCKDGTYTVTINWNDWLEVGMSIEATDRKYRKHWQYKYGGELDGIDYESAIHGGIMPDQGVEVLQRVLGQTLERVTVSRYDLEGMVRLLSSLAGREAATFEAIEEQVKGSGLEKRPPLAVPYQPPTNQVEQTLAAIWSNYFGIAPIGIEDDFFELGGDSLKAMMMVHKIHRELDIRIPLTEFFNNPTVKGQAAYIGKTGKKGFAILPLAEEKEYYPLSSAQQRIYILQRMEEASTGYHITHGLKLTGDIHREKFAEIFRRLIGRHESLRTSFEVIEGEPVQRIQNRVEFEIEYYDLATEGTERKQSKVFADVSRRPGGQFFQKAPPWPPEAIIKNFIRPFDLNCAPLLRVGLIKIAPREHLLMADMHHIVTDGTSVDILIKEFSILYMGKVLPALGFRYKDYSQWQNRWRLENLEEAVNKQELYWLERLWGELPVLELPLDYPRPAVQSFAGSSLSFEISDQVTKQLKAIALTKETTLFILMLTISSIWLSRLSGQEDIVVGSVTAGRKFEELQPVIGMFVNTLALRSFPSREKTFNEFLEEVREGTLSDFENQDYPFDALVERKVSERDTGRNPLFDLMYILQPHNVAGLTIPGLTMTPCRLETGISKFDLSLEGVEEENKLHFTLEYCTKLFKKETIRRFIGYFTKIISSVIANHDISISEIEILNEEEKNRILHEFNDTAADYPKDKTIHRLLEEQVERTPDNTALHGCMIVWLHGEDGFITYKKLNESSNRLAGWLIEKGVQPDTIVGIMMERSVEMIVGILGILKSGAAYLPIDPEYPRERLEYMLKDSRTKILINEKFFGGSRGAVFQKSPPGRRRHYNPAKQTAYINYTSGSTGRPKGVIVEHGNVVRLVKNPGFIEAKQGQHLLMTGMLTFDIVTFEIWWTLLNGLSLYQADKNTILDPAEMEKIITMNRIDILHLVPQVFNQLFSHNPGIFAGLSYFLVGGDLVQPREIRRLRNKYKKLNILHMYGPTEGTTFSTYQCVDKVEENDRGLPIGQPVNNSSVYILGNHDELLPIGVMGQLCLGGPGVARGYLNNPELTADKFCLRRPGGSFRENRPLDPRKSFSLDNSDKNHMQSCNHAIMQFPHSPIYRTGDLARWLPDGNIEFMGRIDQQVKIRGNRIELGEIENRLSNYRGIKHAVVSAFEERNRNKYLVAFIVSDYEIEVSLIREFLLKYLPDYMIPSYFVKVEKIPLNANGKINRKALVPPGENILDDDIECIPPQNAVEKILVEIWKKVLGRKEIGINRNFFTIGGDSIKAIQIISRMSSAGYKLEMKDLFQYPVISDLAPRVKKLKRIPDQSAITGTIPLTPIQEAFFKESFREPHHYNQAIMLYKREGFDKETIKQVFTRIQQHHDALRMTYRKDEHSGKVIQENHGLEYPLYLEEHDLRNSENCSRELETNVNRIQGSINLEKSPLLKLGLYHLNDGDRLIIVIHHLVIDGISWRILFEDLEALYSQYKRGEKLALPTKTDSFKLWSEKLGEYANSKTFLKEKTYWRKIEALQAPLVPKDFEKDNNDSKDTGSASFTLGEEQTGLLLTKVNMAFGTEINDILLTVLGLGIKKTFGQDRLLAAMEGHGREEILEGIDIGRTVGWFTSVYPVLMDLSYAGDPGRQIKEIKETLRRIPNKGIGYGILKYLTREDNKKEIQFKLKPQISFNYLGQLDAEVKQKSSFEIAKESPGNSQGPNNRREYLLELEGMTVNKRLTMTILYDKTRFKPATVSALLDNLEAGLKQIIEFCCTRRKIERTPGDFIYKGLSIASVDRLMAVYPNAEELYTLTPMQEGMLFHALADDSSYSYFQQISYRLLGELEIHLVEKSLKELFKRHDILRTAFVYKDIQRPVQVVLKERAIDLYYQDISKIHEQEEQENIIKEFKEKDKNRSFDLSQGVLMRVSIFQAEETRYEFVWSCHHILMDGWCLGIITEEFFEIYTSYLEKRPYRLPGVKPYRTYIQWLEKQDKEESARYWENYLDSFEEQTGIPKNKITGKEEHSYRNETVSLVFDMEKTAGMNKLAAGNHVTLNTVTQALWGILLGKYNGKEDVVFGAVVSGRPHGLEGVESMVGLFINAIPVRIRYEEKMKFNRLLQQVQEGALACEPHHYHPLAEVQASTTLKQNLIDHLFVFENYPVAEQIEGYGSGKNKSNQTSFQPTNVEVFEQTNYDFNIILSGSERLRISFRYNGNVYDRDFVERMAGHFGLLIDQAVENRELEVREFTLLSEEEKNRVLYEFNDTAVDYPMGKTIHRLFEEQVERTPDRIALLGPGDRDRRGAFLKNRPLAPQKAFYCLTYRELNEQSARVAELLIEKGIQLDTIVGIMMERSVEMIITILGILKSGGAYLPIEPDNPQERIDLMLKDSGIKILVTVPGLPGEIEKLSIVNCQLLIVNEKPSNRRRLNNPSQEAASVNNYQLTINNSQLKGNSLAYVIYTSGSTGKPKGVLTTHANVTRVVKNTNYIQIEPEDRLLQLSNYAFDGSVFDIYGALLNGAELVLINRYEVLEIKRLSGVIKRRGITVFFVTTALFNTLVEMEIGCFQWVRKVLFGGERVSVEHSRKALQYLGKDRIIHVYGPTETTVYATYYFIETIDAAAGNIPIGKPISNTTVYILDKQLKPVLIGVTGEIYIGGTGVARGYLNNPELTAEKFCLRRPGGTLFEKTVPPGPPCKNFSLVNKVPGKKDYRSYKSYLTYILYKTGDLARWLPDGNIEFMGRIDYQVKIRGYRVELGEIENHLRRHPGVEDALVTVIETSAASGNKNLCAYIIGKPGAGVLDIPAVQEYVSARLPHYMTPAYFCQLNEIPMSPGGKINRKALPLPGQQEPGAMVTPPGDELEKTLATLWAEVLEIDTAVIGIDTDFFKCGGHSLNAVVLVAKIHKELNVNVPMRVLFETPFIRGLARYIRGAEKEKHLAVEAAEEKEYYALSPAQERLYILQQMEPNATAYNIPVLMELEGYLDKEKLERVFVKLIRRHESFRTSFEMVAGDPVQKIRKNVEFKIQYYNLVTGGTGATEDKIHHLIHSCLRPFDLECPPLLWVVLTKVEERKHLLVVDIHHIVTDGVSTAIMVREFMALYAGKELSPLKLRYKDFARWQNDRLETGEMKKQEEYWKEIFQGPIPVLQLPYDYPRPAVQSFAGKTIRFRLEPGETASLKGLAGKENVTFFILLLSIYTLVLSRLSGQGDIVMGTAVAGRRHADLQGIIGMFVNTLALRIRLEEDRIFTDFLKKVKEETTAAFDNQEYPFERLVETVSAARDTSRNPLFDVAFSLENMNIPALEIKGLKVSMADFNSGTAKFDLNLVAMESGDCLQCNIEYCTKLFKQETVERFIVYFKEAVSAVVNDPNREIAEIDIIPPEERDRLLFEFNDTGTEYPGDKTIHRLFEEQVERTPDHTALVGRPDRPDMSNLSDLSYISITYRKLNEQSGNLAGLLIEKGVQPDTIMGIKVERSVEIIIGILGILKAGGTYMPIDPEYPQERIDYMLKDSGAKILLTGQEILGLYSSQALYLSEGHHPISPSSGLPNFKTSLFSSLAYVIYTSGSTGKPKGALVEHSAVVNLVSHQEKFFKIETYDRVLQFSTLCFDASVEQIFVTILNGALLVLIPKETLMDGDGFEVFITRQSITHLHAVPSFLNQVRPGCSNHLRRIVSGGDICPVELAEKWSKYCNFYNEYGPTETTVTSIEKKVKKGEKIAEGLPIGRLIGNTRVYLLDKGMRLVPVGSPGDLYIGGHGLVRGYLNLPELTAEKFVISHSSLIIGSSKNIYKSTNDQCPMTNDRLYKTGDLARWLPNGNIEFIGRIDTQVKIRGFRIEPGEIESRLAHHENIKEAVVIGRTDSSGEKYLCAYVVYREPTDVKPTELKSYLSQTLPQYMIPAHFLEVEKIPLNPNGKVDRNKLPEPGARPGSEYVAPGTDKEREIAEVWTQVLGQEKIGIYDNFFDTGGNSLKIIKLAMELKKHLGIELPTAKMFQYTTIAAQARYIGGAEEKKSEEKDVDIEAKKAKNKLKQRRNKSRR